MTPSLAKFSPCENREDSCVIGTWVYLFPFWRSDRMRGISVLNARCCSYLKCRGILLGVGHSQGMGILFEFSRTPWHFTTVAIHHSSYSYGWLSNSPSASNDSQCRHDSHMEENSHHTGAYLNNMFLFTSYFYTVAPTKSFLFQNKI